MPVGTLCSGEINKLRPTQQDLGKREVKRKAEKLKNFSSSEYKAYIEKNIVPAVIGPGGSIYIVDHHHFISALEENGHHHADLKIIANWSKQREETFWKNMKSHHYVYLKDRYGNSISPYQLPTQFKDMGNNVFRSLAGAVISKGAYSSKADGYFIEFEWALFFRKHFSEAQVEEHYKESVEEALKLARSKEAKGLPGYIPANPCDDDLNLAIFQIQKLFRSGLQSRALYGFPVPAQPDYFLTGTLNS